MAEYYNAIWHCFNIKFIKILLLKIQILHHMHSYLLYWYTSPQKHRLFNSYISNDIKCLAVHSIQYLEWRLFTYFVHTLFKCCLPALWSFLCRAHPMTWADAVPLKRKWRNWHVFIVVHQAAFRAPAYMNSFFSLVKKDYTDLQSFVWYSVGNLNC